MSQACPLEVPVHTPPLWPHVFTGGLWMATNFRSSLPSSGPGPGGNGGPELSEAGP